jgi:ER membrane protein complex subunit 1
VDVQYTYWNQKLRRIELAVLEMYEGNRQSNSTAFSSFHPPPPPIVMRQAYIFPGHLSAIAATVTEKGIASKELLCKL